MKGISPSRIFTNVATAFVIATLSLDNATGQAAKPDVNLCNKFDGSFRWNIANDPVQFVEMRVLQQKKTTANKLQVTGTGTYTVRAPSETTVTNMRFTWEIDTATLGMTMVESDPDREDFVTDGDYTGTISPDFRTIIAVWKTHSTGETGILKLSALCDEVS